MSQRITNSYYRELAGTVPVTTRLLRRWKKFLRRWRFVLSIGSVTLVVLKLVSEIGFEIVIWFSTILWPPERRIPPEPPPVPIIDGDEIPVPSPIIPPAPGPGPGPVDPPSEEQPDDRTAPTPDTVSKAQQQLHEELAKLHNQLGELLLREDADQVELLHVDLPTGRWLDQLPAWLNANGYQLPRHVSASIRVSRERWDHLQDLLARFGSE